MLKLQNIKIQDRYGEYKYVVYKNDRLIGKRLRSNPNNIYQINGTKHCS